MKKIKEKNNKKTLKENTSILILAILCIGIMIGNFLTVVDYKVVDVAEITVRIQIFGSNYIFENNK